MFIYLLDKHEGTTITTTTAAAAAATTTTATTTTTLTKIEKKLIPLTNVQ